MVVSRGREDQSSFWPEPRIVQMSVERLRHHQIRAHFLRGVNFGWIVVDMTGAFLQALSPRRV